MTLQDFFTLLERNPSILLFYFIAIPLTAFLAGIFGRGEGHLTPWRYLYGVLIYLVCIPGVLSFFLNVYVFLFERQSIFNLNITTQLLPIVSMLLTLFIIHKNVDFDDVPGFDKISGLVIIITTLLVFMWVIDRTRIIIFSLMPFYLVFVLFVVMIFVMKWGFSKIMK